MLVPRPMEQFRPVQMERLRNAGRVAQAEWRRDLRYASLDQGGRQDAGSRCALYAEGRGGLCGSDGKARRWKRDVKGSLSTRSDCDHPAGPARCADLAKARRRRDGEAPRQSSWRVRVRPEVGGRRQLAVKAAKRDDHSSIKSTLFQ